jgi:flagellar M-ring protein FliF
MDGAGHLLASGQDQFANSITGSIDMQRQIEQGLEEKVALALGPQLGAFNYRVGIQAQIDTDNSTTQETIFDPASRVERSVQVVRSEDSSTQKTESKNTSVEQNLPQATPTNATGGPLSAETSQKREETTNYEINSKKVDTQRNGYRIQKLSISIVVNKIKLTEILGANARQTDIDARLAEIQKIVSTAAGFDEPRGDKINVSATEFVDDAAAPATPSGYLDKLSIYTGTLINAAAFLIVTLLVLFLGIKPLITAVTKLDSDINSTGAANDGLGEETDGETARPTSAQSYVRSSFSEEFDNIKPDIMIKTKIAPAERLRAMTEMDVERTALVLRKWLLEEAA